MRKLRNEPLPVAVPIAAWTGVAVLALTAGTLGFIAAGLLDAFVRGIEAGR